MDGTRERALRNSLDEPRTTDGRTDSVPNSICLFFLFISFFFLLFIFFSIVPLIPTTSTMIPASKMEPVKRSSRLKLLLLLLLKKKKILRTKFDSGFELEFYVSAGRLWTEPMDQEQVGFWRQIESELVIVISLYYDAIIAQYYTTITVHTIRYVRELFTILKWSQIGSFALRPKNGTSPLFLSYQRNPDIPYSVLFLCASPAISHRPTRWQRHNCMPTKCKR